MTNRRRRWLGSSALIAALVFARWVGAVAPEIKDAGKFFSDAAIKKANNEIREIAKNYGRDLLIETFPTIPGDQAERVKGLSLEARAKFFRNWATDRADLAVVHGVYILVCREPPFLEIILTPKGRQAFNQESFEKLRNLVLQMFCEKHYDEALQSAVNMVRERFAAAASNESK